MHFEKRHFETQVPKPKRASHLEQYQLTKASHLSTQIAKSGTKASRPKDSSSRLLNRHQNFNTSKGRALRNVQIDLGSSSAGRLNTSSHHQQMTSPGSKLPFKNNAMSRMVPRQSELKAYSSLDNNAKRKKGRGGQDGLSQLQDNSSIEKSRVQKPVRNINLDDDDGEDGSENMNELHESRDKY